MQPFEPTLESLQKYNVPEWYKDAKFGIYTHWGPYAVPAFSNEWYPNHMYYPEHEAFQHHKQTWGDQSEFGYKDFIPMFTAERFDPDRWADIFKRSGARFAGPVAEHHDGFAMYNCKFTPYNATAMGPKRDITGELKKTIESAGMKFAVTSHRAHNARHFPALAGSDRMDPAYKALYWKPREPVVENLITATTGGSSGTDAPVDEEFLKDWLGRTKELADNYQPDVLWFDFGWHRPEFTPYRLELVSYYYNRAQEWGKEVVVNYKDRFFDGAAVYNIERGKLSGIREEYWQTDTSVSTKSWGYIQNEHFKSATRIIHDLVDIVSKNGNMLLSFGPRADGSFPPEVEGLFLAVGEWLEINGEAIYGTRYWEKYGEGPTVVEAGHFSESKDTDFTNKDIRFTQKPGELYAIILGWPGRTTTIRSLASGCGIRPTRIAMLGSEATLEWKQDHEGLHVTLPGQKPCDHAYSLKIT